MHHQMATGHFCQRVLDSLSHRNITIRGACRRNKRFEVLDHGVICYRTREELMAASGTFSVFEERRAA